MSGFLYMILNVVNVKCKKRERDRERNNIIKREKNTCWKK